MALVEETLFGRVDKVQIAIDRLKSFEPPEGYFLAFSGGKDSQAIYHLAKMAGVKFDAHYSVTSVDPPELVRFLKREYPDVIWNYYRYPDGRRKTMWNIIEQHTIPPMRQARYCCSELKETSGKGRVVVTGVRWDESVRRKENHGIAEIRTTSKKLHEQADEGDSAVKKTKQNDSIVFLDDNSTARNMVEQCYAKKKTTVNPIIDWTEEDVWEFLNEVAKVPHCELYDEGFTRLGCIGCPLQGREGMLRDFERWPRYKQKYIKAFDRMIANHPGEIKVSSGELAKPNAGGQLCGKWLERSGTSITGSAIPRLLAVAMQVGPDGSECSPAEKIQRGRTDIRRKFNRDPQVADYKDGYEVLELMLGDLE